VDCTQPNIEIHGGEWVKIVNKNAIVTTPKRNVIFNSQERENVVLIERLCQIEKEIVDRYIASYCPTKFASYALKTQLLSGTIKYHSENSIIESPVSIKSRNHMGVGEKQMKDKYILKISGIWETATQVGITMKFILAH
jgi:hypothetical protein